MPQGYFSFFPNVQYGNNIVTNIFAKVRFDEAISKNLARFYPYEIKEGERPDQIADWYYGDPYYDWVVYLSNATVDPYFEWPMTQNQLKDFVVAKYGSEANAQQQILFYRNNFYGDDTILSVSGYSGLAASQRFYWQPISGTDGTTVGYERKGADIVVDTNQVLRLDGTFASAAPAETLYISQGSAAGFVSQGNTSVLMLKHITGAFANGALDRAAGTVTGVTIISNTFPAATSAYYSPVSAYEYEDSVNSARNTIRLLQVQYLDTIVHDMKVLLNA